MPRRTNSQNISEAVYQQITGSSLTPTQQFAITQGLLIRVLRDLPPSYRGVSLALAKLEEEGVEVRRRVSNFNTADKS